MKTELLVRVVRKNLYPPPPKAGIYDRKKGVSLPLQYCSTIIRDLYVT